MCLPPPAPAALLPTPAPTTPVGSEPLAPSQSQAAAAVPTPAPGGCDHPVPQAWGAGGIGKTKPTTTGRTGAGNLGNTPDDPTGLVVGCWQTQGTIKGTFVKSTAQAKQQKARFHPKGSTKAHPNFFPPLFVFDWSDIWHIQVKGRKQSPRGPVALSSCFNPLPQPPSCRAPRTLWAPFLHVAQAQDGEDPPLRTHSERHTGKTTAVLPGGEPRLLAPTASPGT